MINNVFAIHRCVHNRVFFQRSNGGFHKERHKTQLHAVCFFKFVFVFGAQIHYRLHVDFVKRSQNGVLRLRFQQTFRHARAQAAHRHALFKAFARRQCGSLKGRGGFGRGRRVLHVFFQHAAAAPRALDLAHVHAFFGGELGSGGHGNACLAVRCGLCRCGRSRGSLNGIGSRRGLRGSGFGVNFGEQLLRGNGFTVLHHNFHQHARLRRRHFQHHFIGFNIHQRFIAGNAFAHFFIPFEQGALGDAFGKYGYVYFNNHDLSPMGFSFTLGQPENGKMAFRLPCVCLRIRVGAGQPFSGCLKQHRQSGFNASSTNCFNCAACRLP